MRIRNIGHVGCRPDCVEQQLHRTGRNWEEDLRRAQLGVHPDGLKKKRLNSYKLYGKT